MGPKIGLHFGVRIISQEVLKDELQKLKSQQSDLRKAMRQNRKEARNANKRKKRLFQGPLIFLENDQVPGVREFVWR